MYNININKSTYLISKKIMLLQVLNTKKIEIPRFCYNEKLNIAGNCRLCIIEIEKNIKPIVSCAYPIINNMEVLTNTILVKKAREGILEFLLINHPLDCPICDWGGECDLQDQVLLFGNDRGRFYENKRAILEKYISPMIKMLMTRCIHCTRCVRFLVEIAGDYSLGVVGRGLKMEISNYLKNLSNSDILGNIIDLCPVGALTSVPYLFKNRPWKINKKIMNLDLFDSLGSNIYVEILNNQISRILPKFNNYLNEDWISDKIRFFYDSLSYQRLGYPIFINLKSKKLIYLSWENAFLLIKKKIKFYKIKNKNSIKIIGIFGGLVDIETLLIFKDFLNTFGSSEIFNEFEKLNLNIDFRSNYLFSLDLNQFNQLNCCFLIGIDIAKESPILQLKLKKIFNLTNMLIFLIGSNVKTTLNTLKNLNLNLNGFIMILEGNHWISSYLISVNNWGFIFGSNFINRLDSLYLEKKLLFLKKKIKMLFKNKKLYFNYFLLTVSNLNAFELGIYKKTKIKKYKFSNIIYCLDINKIKSISNNNNFIIYQGYSGSNFINNVDLILPSVSYLEKNIISLNIFNNLQLGKKCLSKKFNSKNDIKIFAVLSFFLNKEFNFFSKFYILKRLSQISPLFLKNQFINNKKYSIEYIEISKLNIFFYNTVLILLISNFYKNEYNLINNSKNLLKILKSKNLKKLYI